MAIRITQQKAEDLFLEQGWKLTEVYVGIHHYHNVICYQCNTPNVVRLIYCHKHACKHCKLIKRREEVKSILLSFGLSTGVEYFPSRESVRTQIEFHCDKGHVFNSCYDRTLYEKQCPVCYKESKPKRPGKNVLVFRGLLKNAGWEYVSGEYTDQLSLIKASCLRGHLQEKQFAFYFNRSADGRQMCRQCASENSIVWTEEAVKSALPPDIELVDFSKMPIVTFKCKKDGHIWSVGWYTHKVPRQETKREAIF